MYIKADLVNPEGTIPDGVSAKLNVDSDLSAIDVDGSRFPRKGDYYVSRDYESAENRVEIDLHYNLSRVQVK